MDAKHTQTEQEIMGLYCCWKELRPFKYCMVRPRELGNYSSPTDRMCKQLESAFVAAAYRHKIKDKGLKIDAFLHEMYDQVLAKDYFYKDRLYTPKEVVENLYKIANAIPGLLKGARPSYAQIAVALNLNDTYTQEGK